jgi:hypothetical protein
MKLYMGMVNEYESMLLPVEQAAMSIRMCILG